MPEEQQKQSLFLRDATGLKKNVSFLDSISLNIGWMTLGAPIGFIGFTLVLFPTMDGVNLVYAAIISFLLVIPQMIIYTIMQRRMSRTGGDYVWMSRQLGGFVGTVVGFTGAGLNLLSFIAIIILSTVFTIGSVGLALGYPSFLGLALPGNVAGADPLLQFVIGASIFTALVGLNILAPKYAFKLLTIIIIIGLLGLIAGMGVMLAGGHSGVVNYMNSLGNSNLTYDKVASSFTGSYFNFRNTILLLPFFFLFLFPWFNMATITGSELKKGGAVNWSVPIAGFIVFLLTVGTFGIMYYVGGYNFINAAMSNPTLVFDYGFNFWTLAMGMSSSPTISLFLGISWILWNVAILIVSIIAFSRYILAYAFDRFLPSALGYVSPRYGSPVVAHIADLVVSVAMVGLAAFLYGPLSAISSTGVAPMFFFAFVGLATAIYAVKHEKNLVKAALVTAGILNVLIFGYVAYQFFANAAIYGGNILSYSYLTASVVISIVIYLVSKWYHKQHNLDISLVFKEIPPE